MTLNVSERRSNNVNNADELVFRGVSSVLDKHSKRVWIGTMTELATAVNRVLSKNQRSFAPKSPSAFRVVLNRVTNRLRNKGISVKFGRTSDHSRTRFVKFAR